jgi:hypothetical protein
MRRSHSYACGKTLEMGSSRGRYNPCRLENRSGQGRLRTGHGTSVASRDGLAARGPRAKDGPFASKISRSRYSVRRISLGLRTVELIRPTRLKALDDGTASDRPSM